MAKKSVASLTHCVNNCRADNVDQAAYMSCVNDCEATFMLGDGNTEVDPPSGGKVFRDTTGGKVFIDPNGAIGSAPPGY
jgi:hypothetical protein